MATLKWKASSMVLADVSMNAWGIVPPTLLTTRSSRPKASRARSTRAATASRSFRLAGTATARRPASSTCRATASSCSAVLAEMTTSAPAWARPIAVAAPIPRPAPVTMATLSVIWKRSRIMLVPFVVRRQC